MRRILAFSLAALVASAVAASAPPAGTPGGDTTLPRVTLIGDSVATGIAYNEAAKDVLAEGVDLRLELEPCRRVDGVSCPYDGKIPANVVDLVGSLGPALGDTVIVSVGYNDYESLYEDNIETALAALRRAGVVRVLWVTLRAERQSYVRMNETIDSVAARHVEMAVVDWNLYSRSHPDWFQPDGLHLGYEGAVAMATLFHKALERLGIPVVASPPPTSAATHLQVATRTLPAARSGAAYRAQLRATGGRAPYRWSRGAPFPSWLALSPGGRLTGTVRAKRGTLVAVTVRVTDAARTSVSRRLSLRVPAGAG